MGKAGADEKSALAKLGIIKQQCFKVKRFTLMSKTASGAESQSDNLARLAMCGASIPEFARRIAHAR